MSESKLYKGRGTPEMFDDYMDFINYVFGFNGNSSDFKKLLPKLYQYDYNPAGNSYVVSDNGKLRAAIGAYDHDITVCGTTLRTRGIGNVAVHPYHRSKGYMKDLMEMAVGDMIKDGVVLSVLGGRRQRYRYFSFEKLGPEYEYTINSDNIRHTFGKEFTQVFTFEKVGPGDAEVLGEIRKLSGSMPLYAERAVGKRYYETLVSWKCGVLSATAGGTFAGYAIVKDNEVSEFLVTEDYKNRVREFVRDLYVHLGNSKLELVLPAFLQSYREQLEDIPEGLGLCCDKMFSVLNFRAVTEAFLKLKATYSKLTDGRLVLDIGGRGGHERIAVAVENGKPSVEYTDDTPDFTLGHAEAMNLIFSPFCPARENAPDCARLWFPLPLFIYSADTV